MCYTPVVGNVYSQITALLVNKPMNESVLVALSMDEVIYWSMYFINIVPIKYIYEEADSPTCIYK